jgi:WhiB family transcriptional regulator, redox-sensing transcriptional regulator
VTAPAASYHGASWRESAACRGCDPELFFPIGKAGPAVVQAQRAKAICARCPVRQCCLAFALDTRQEYGIWGGHDEDERRILHRRRQPGTSRSLRIRDLPAAALGAGGGAASSR